MTDRRLRDYRATHNALDPDNEPGWKKASRHATHRERQERRKDRNVWLLVAFLVALILGGWWWVILR